MHLEFWQDRWARGQIGFHQSAVESWLDEFCASVLSGPGRIFVPLCGKSLDLLWLRDHGHEVVGVELADVALEAFCAENGIPARRRSLQAHDIYEARGLKLLRGDFFAATPDLLGAVTAIYDRASLVSFAPERRGLYAAHLQAVAPAAERMLVIVVEYPQREMQGPPFPVDGGELERLFSRSFTVKELARRDAMVREQRWRERGVSRMFDVCYQLDRRDGQPMTSEDQPGAAS